MAELGMKLVEAGAPPGKDPATHFARIARTIHQAIKLEAKLTAPPPPAARRRSAAPKPEPRRPPPPPEVFPDPPRTEWPFLKPLNEAPAEASPPPAPPPAPNPAAAPPQARPDVAPEPKSPWIPPPPQRRATDPPRPTGPNWARLFER